MNIFINDEKVDFIIEREKKVKDILDSVFDYVKEHGFVTKTVSIDGEELDDDPKSFNRELDGIENMHFFVKSKAEQDYEKLSILLEYSNIIKNSILNYIENPTEENNALIAKNLADLNEFKTLFYSVDEYEFDISFLAYVKEIPSQTCVKLNLVIEKLEQRMLEIENPRQNFFQNIKKLYSQMPDIENVSFEFQRGNDRMASEFTREIIETLKDMLRIYSYAKFDFSDFEENINDIKLVIKELNNALKNSDNILLSDLLEYELQPKVEQLYQKVV